MLPRHQQFVDQLLADPELNATRAYRVVYPSASEEGARRNAHKLLTRTDIQAALAVAREKRSKSTQITAERVLLELARLAFSDVRRLYHADGRLKALHELDDDAAAALASVETDEAKDGETEAFVRTRKVKLWDKREALNLLGKHLGLFLERVHMTGEVKSAAPPLNLGALSDEQLRQFRTLLAAAAPPAGPDGGPTARTG